MKPEFNSHEGLSSLSCQAHLLAEALLCYADDEGFFNANPVLVRAGTCPLRKDFKNISKLMAELASVGYLRFGTFNDKRFGQIVNFKLHQKISHPAKSKISKNNIIWENSPENSGMALELSGVVPENSGDTPETFRPDQGTGNREQGTGNGEQGTGNRGADSGEAPESARLLGDFSSRSRFKNSDMVRRVNDPVPLSDEAHMIATAVSEMIGATKPWAREQIAQQAELELKKFPGNLDTIRDGMAQAWQEYTRCKNAGKLSDRGCGMETFFGEGRWRSPKLWGLKPGMRAYGDHNAA